MTDLKVVDESETPEEPTGVHLKIRYDGDSAVGSIYDGERFISSTGYVYVAKAGGWQAARDECVRLAAKKMRVYAEYGAPPEPETLLASAMPEGSDDDVDA